MHFTCIYAVEIDEALAMLWIISVLLKLSNMSKLYNDDVESAKTTETVKMSELTIYTCDVDYKCWKVVQCFV